MLPSPMTTFYVFLYCHLMLRHRHYILLLWPMNTLKFPLHLHHHKRVSIACTLSFVTVWDYGLLGFRSPDLYALVTTLDLCINDLRESVTFQSLVCLVQTQLVPGRSGIAGLLHWQTHTLTLFYVGCYVRGMCLINFCVEIIEHAFTPVWQIHTHADIAPRDIPLILRHIDGKACLNLKL